MLRIMLHGKVHGVTVAQADLNYARSVRIGRALPEAGRPASGEHVDVVDVPHGNRLRTHVVEGVARSGLEPSLAPPPRGRS